MKYLITFLFSLILLTSTSAQVQKGAILTGGSFTFTGQKNNNEFSVSFSGVEDEFKRTFIAARPQIGFFVNESTLLGIGLSFEHNSFRRVSSFNGSPNIPFEEKSNLVLINPYFTKYSKLVDKLYFTTAINFLAGIGKVKYGIDDPLETNLVALRLNISPGLTYFISEKWALNAGIGQLFYNWSREKITSDIGFSEDPKNTENDYGVSFNINTFNIGFQYILKNGEK